MSSEEQTLAPWRITNVVGIAATSRSQKKLVKKLLRKALGEGLVTDIHSIQIEMSPEWEQTGIFIGTLFGSDSCIFPSKTELT